MAAGSGPFPVPPCCEVTARERGRAIVSTAQPQAAIREELRLVEEDLARIRETATDLRRRISERADYPTDPAELSALIEEAEEQEFLADELEARREELLRRLGSSP